LHANGVACPNAHKSGDPCTVPSEPISHKFKPVCAFTTSAAISLSGLLVYRIRAEWRIATTSRIVGFWLSAHIFEGW
jgi:hypothetical protein